MKDLKEFIARWSDNNLGWRVVFAWGLASLLFYIVVAHASFLLTVLYSHNFLWIPGMALSASITWILSVVREIKFKSWSWVILLIVVYLAFNVIIAALAYFRFIVMTSPISSFITSLIAGAILLGIYVLNHIGKNH